MKVFAPVVVLAALVFAATAAAFTVASTDGTLTVKSGVGKIQFQGKGGVIGRLAKGQVTIKDPDPSDGTGPIVTGADAVDVLNDTTTRYRGNDIRFRIIGGRMTVTVDASGIDLSAIGSGGVRIDGRGTADDGTWALNGAPPQKIPDASLWLALGSTPAAG
jgi:hypothetical protein